ncbi:MAG: dipeptidyl-peptidase-4 [Planctomycetota bacterium]|jgi:dipeptidyl-peptidase-4
MQIRCLIVLVILICCCPSGFGQKAAAKKADGKWTLEQVFPKKSMFGPSARSMAFSSDGKFAAYLYRGYSERRHGYDLWVLDTETGTKSRVTSVSVLAKYQEDTRKVQSNRVKKNRKNAKKKRAADKNKKPKPDSTAEKKSGDKKKEGQGDGKNKKEKQNKSPEAGKGKGDFVTGKDADDKKAPRYSGVSSIEWSPEKNELLFVSGGDLYRFRPVGRSIARLTATRGSISSAKYLPDGNGYVYRDDSALIRVRFGEDLIDRIDPKLPAGEKIQSFKVSPNGKNLVLMTTKSDPTPNKSRKVSIANYRDRFMKTREVSRQVSDDPITKRKTMIYLCKIGDTNTESGKLQKIWTQEKTGPRDILRTPEWSERSDRVAFLVYEQKNDTARVVEARFLSRKKRMERVLKKRKTKAKAAKEEARIRKEEGKAPKKNKKTPPPSNKEELDKEPIAESKVVYEFKHTGGPNTPGMMTPRYLADGNRMVLLTEQSGFRHLHVLDPIYSSLDQLTRGRFEVYPVKMSEDRKWLFVTATKGNPSCQNPYKVNLETGEMVPLAQEEGTYSNLAFSCDGEHVLGNFVRYGALKELVHIDVAKSKKNMLTDSHPKMAAKFTKVSPKFFSYTNRHGHTIHGHMFKPTDMKKDEKRPLLIYVYGGPLGTRKQVNEGSYSSDAYFFAQYMTRIHGYVTCTIDPRGASGYGGAFESANFEQVGKPQVEDLVDGVKFMIKSHQVDAKRVAIHGWSFGGFQTQMCLYTEPDVFKCGMAGAGPTEWENYNSWYSTGTIGNSRIGKPDLKKYSLLPLAKNLEGELLLVHGMEDSNVLYQDTVRVYRELLKAGKETHVELFLDPTGGHGLGGDIKRLNRARKYEEFLLRNL